MFKIIRFLDKNSGSICTFCHLATRCWYALARVLRCLYAGSKSANKSFAEQLQRNFCCVSTLMSEYTDWIARKIWVWSKSNTSAYLLSLVQSHAGILPKTPKLEFKETATKNKLLIRSAVDGSQLLFQRQTKAYIFFWLLSFYSQYGCMPQEQKWTRVIRNGRAHARACAGVHGSATAHAQKCVRKSTGEWQEPFFLQMDVWASTLGLHLLVKIQVISFTEEMINIYSICSLGLLPSPLLSHLTQKDS